MKVGKVMKKLLVLVAALCMIGAMAVTTFAAEASQEVIEAKNGVVQVNLVWVTDRGDEISLAGGSGFLINSDTIITCYHVIAMSSLDQAEVAAVVGDSYSKNYESHIKYKVVVYGDMQVDATYVNGSENTDFAILRLNSPANNKKILPLAESSELEVTESIYALGFPAAVAELQSVSLYDSDDVTVTDGTVSKTLTEGKVDLIQHSAELTNGNSGGPLLNEKGEVLGICKGYLDSETGTNYYYAIAIDQVKKALDSVGIEYTVASGSLDAELTDETTVSVEDETIEDTTTEQATVPPTTVSGSTANEGSSAVIIIAIIAVIVVIVIVVLIIVLAVSGNKKKVAPTPVQPNRPIPPVQNTPPVAPAPMPMQGVNMNQGAGETTVLNEGAGETTVLGGQPTATLLRLKNGEKITINRPEFVIGKERRRVDYCIADNNSVSRCHSKVVTRGGQHFIIDMNSTNFTYVNGSKLAPNQEKALTNGDKIKISDEEFEFRTF